MPNVESQCLFVVLQVRASMHGFSGRVSKLRNVFRSNTCADWISGGPIERDLGIEFDQWEVPTVDPTTYESTKDGVFFAGDAAFGPKNIIEAVEQGHQAAISIHKYCNNEAMTERLPYGMNLVTAKMGIHEWSYSNDFDYDDRYEVPTVPMENRFKDIHIEVELGFEPGQFKKEVERCLNCDIQTDFVESLCIECDACIDICPVNCLTITENGEEEEIRKKIKTPADNLDQALYVSDNLPQTGRVMVKDEDLCLHCGLCAERCPTGAWDMQKFFYMGAQSKDGCSG